MAFNDCRYRFTALPCVFVAAYDADVIAAFADHIHARHFVVNISGRICSRLSKPPYVCNGCENKRSCTLEKRVYSATYAQKEYEALRSECRQGLQITEEEAIRLDSIISPLFS